MEKISDMRCVVMGGGGFIGTNLCLALNGKVESLRAFGRRQSFPSAMRGIEWIPGDFFDPSSIATAVSGMDVVFHLVTATTPNNSNVDKIADLQSNVVPTLRLLEACKQESVKRVVFISSGGAVYGAPTSVPIPENAPTTPISAYGISKLAIEKYLSLHEYLYGIEHRILRVANPYGPYQTIAKNQGVIATFIARALNDRPIEVWGDGSVIKDYIYISDVISALCQVSIHQGNTRIFNIGSGKGHTIRQVITEIEKTLGMTLKVNYREAKKTDVPLNILDVQSAAADLDWHPTIDLGDGIAKTINWAKEHSSLYVPSIEKLLGSK